MQYEKPSWMVAGRGRMPWDVGVVQNALGRRHGLSLAWRLAAVHGDNVRRPWWRDVPPELGGVGVEGEGRRLYLLPSISWEVM